MGTSNIRAARRAAAIVGLTAAWLPVAELDLLRRPAAQRHAAFERHARAWARRVLSLSGVHLHVEPSPRLPDGPLLVVASHRTTFDPLVVLSLFGGHILSRGDVADWPVVGRGARALGVVFVDRSNRSSGAAAIRTIRRLLREGRTVTVFPEGTTHRGDEVHPFLPGAFAAARGLDVDVLPVGLAYPPGSEWEGEGFSSHASRVVGTRRTDVGVRIGEPVHLGTVRSADAAARMRDEVQRLTTEARGLLAGVR